MKAYILMSQMYEDVSIKGVYLSKTKAEEKMRCIGHLKESISGEIWLDDEGMWLDIVETELNIDNGF